MPTFLFPLCLFAPSLGANGLGFVGKKWKLHTPVVWKWQSWELIQGEQVLVFGALCIFFCLHSNMCVIVCVCVFLWVCPHYYCLDQPAWVYVCCADFSLLNCLEVEWPSSVNQAERPVYPATHACAHAHNSQLTTHTPYKGKPWLLDFPMSSTTSSILSYSFYVIYFKKNLWPAIQYRPLMNILYGGFILTGRLSVFDIHWRAWIGLRWGNTPQTSNKSME